MSVHVTTQGNKAHAIGSNEEEKNSLSESERSSGNGVTWDIEMLLATPFPVDRVHAFFGVETTGPMAGTIDVKSYGYVYIAGDLTGSVNVRSYATVVIDGDIVGTLSVKSYTDLLLRGRVIGKLEAKGSCWSTFYFESYHSRAELERLGKDCRSVTLHVKESDLPQGKQKVGGWRNVIVGGDVWKKIPPR